MAPSLPIFRWAVLEIIWALPRRPRCALATLRIVGRRAALTYNSATQACAVCSSAGSTLHVELRVESLFRSSIFASFGPFGFHFPVTKTWSPRCENAMKEDSGTPSTSHLFPGVHVQEYPLLLWCQSRFVSKGLENSLAGVVTEEHSLRLLVENHQLLSGFVISLVWELATVARPSSPVRVLRLCQGSVQVIVGAWCPINLAVAIALHVCHIILVREPNLFAGMHHVQLYVEWPFFLQIQHDRLSRSIGMTLSLFLPALCLVLAEA